MVTHDNSFKVRFCYIIINKLEILNRQEIEDRVIDLYYNQKKTYREIEKLVRKSPRDIRTILNKVEPPEHSMSVSSRAYKLFSEHKSPIEVAIALNIKEPEATQFYIEYWKLNQLYDLCGLYEEVKDGIWSFVRLYRLANAAGMGLQRVINLVNIANNDLPSVQFRFENLKREVGSLEAEKRNSARIYQELSDEITSLRKRKDYVRSCCEIEEYRVRQLYRKNSDLMEFIQFFEDNNETYLTIKKTVEEKVHSTLSNGKMLLKLAVLSLIESIRNNPDKFSSLLYRNVPSSTTDYSGQYYGFCMNKKQYSSYHYDGKAPAGILLEEAEKLYNKLAKETVDEIIDGYVSRITSSSLSSDEEQKKTYVSQPILDYKTESNVNRVHDQLENNDAAKINS